MAAAIGRVTKVPEIRKGDTVVVLAGKDAGKQGKVERVIRRLPSPTGGKTRLPAHSAAGGVKVVVEGLNIAKRHTKPRQSQGQSDRMPKIQQGGILELAQPIPIGRVMLVCSELRASRPGSPTRPWTRAGASASAGTAASSRRSSRDQSAARAVSLGGRARAAEAVRVRQPEPDPARLEDRRQHRPRRGADQREVARRRARRPHHDHRPEADRDQGQALDRPVPRADGQLDRREGDPPRRADVGLPGAADDCWPCPASATSGASRAGRSTGEATTPWGCASNSRSPRSITTR